MLLFVSNIIIHIQSLMQASENKLLKKYHKLTLKSLKIPSPPPFQKQESPSPTKSSKQSSEKCKNDKKQQAIQKTQSSSEQQMYYENYFMLQLENLIENIVGSNVEFQIIQLREGSEGDGDVVDVGVRVGVELGKEGQLKERIRLIKQSSTATKQKPHKKPQNPQKPEQNSYKIQLQQQKTQATSTRNLKYQQQMQQINGLQYQQQVSSEQQKQKQAIIFHKNSGKFNQSALYINDEPQEMKEIGKKDKKKSQNRKDQAKSKVRYYDQIDGQAEGDEGDDDENDSKNIRNLRKSRSQGPSSGKKWTFCHKVLVFFIGFGIVFAFMLLLITKNSSNNELDSSDYPQPTKQQIAKYPNKFRFPYQGDLPTIQKIPYFTPSTSIEQIKDLRVNCQTLPAVSKAQESLHPMNLTYFRPVQAKLFTFPLNANYMQKANKSNLLKMSHTAAQIQKYWVSLGKNEGERVSALYINLHKQLLNQSDLLLQTEYTYLNKKYDLNSHPSYMQKPLCLVHYTRNSFSTRKYLQFYTSLMQQNFTKFRVVHIEDNPDSPHESLLLMNYLWKQWKSKIQEVDPSSFFFLQLGPNTDKINNQVGKYYAKTAAVRELCGDGDIVVQIDGVLLGRQALSIISGLYDGGSQRMSLMPKQKIKTYPYFYAKNIEINDNLKKQQFDQKQQQTLNDNKIKPTFSPEAAKQIQQIKNKNNNQSTTKNENKENTDRQTNRFQNSVFIGRYIGQIWSLYSNYIYTTKSQNSQSLIYTSINTSQYQNIYNSLKRSLSSSPSPNTFKSLPSLHLSATCLKSYIMPLQIKLSILPPQQNINSKVQYFSTEEFGYDLEVFYNMLEMAGRWSNREDNNLHYVDVVQPLCHRNDVNIQSECQNKQKTYEQINALSKPEYLPMYHILQQVPRIKETSNTIRNQIKSTVHTLIAKMRPQILQACEKKEKEKL